MVDIENKLTRWDELLTGKQARLSLLEEDLVNTEGKQKHNKQVWLDRTQAQAIIQAAAELAQSMLQAQLSDITSAALAAVFLEDPYEFVVNFIAKRGGTECEFNFKKGEELLKLFSDDSGFGAIDVASNALRISYLNSGDNRKVLLIDEPYKNLSKVFLPQAAEVISSLCHELGIQIIMITHIPEFAEIADRVFEVTQDRQGRSHVEVISKIN